MKVKIEARIVEKYCPSNTKIALLDSDLQTIIIGKRIRASVEDGIYKARFLYAEFRPPSIFDKPEETCGQYLLVEGDRIRQWWILYGDPRVKSIPLSDPASFMQIRLV